MAVESINRWIDRTRDEGLKRIVQGESGGKKDYMSIVGKDEKKII